MGKPKNIIQEDLERYLEINSYVKTLKEQLGMGGLSRYGPAATAEAEARAEAEIKEQEDAPEEDIEDITPDAPEGEEGMEDAEAEEPEAEEPGGEEGMEGEEEMDIETELEDIGGDSTEIDVTDLVTNQEDMGKEIKAEKDILSKNTEQLTSLLTKLGELETQLGGMGKMVSQIEKLEQKIEKYRPQTPQEKLDARKYDSGPFSHSLVDFYKDSEDRFEKSGKDDYILRGDELENYNNSEIKQSFNVD